MARKDKKTPSRIKYEEEHPTISFRLDRETKEQLEKHLEDAGCSFAVFVKDALGREKTMVEQRVAKLASRQIEERKTPTRALELYDLVLDLARWSVVLWASLPDPTEVPCPDCLFPTRLSNRESRTVMMEMLDSGDLECPECGLTFKSLPQLAWVLLLRIVAEEVRRQKFLGSKGKQANDKVK